MKKIYILLTSGTQVEIICLSLKHTDIIRCSTLMHLRQAEFKSQEPKRVKVTLFFFVSLWRHEVRRRSLSLSWELAGLFRVAITTRD